MLSSPTPFFFNFPRCQLYYLKPRQFALLKLKWPCRRVNHKCTSYRVPNGSRLESPDNRRLVVYFLVPSRKFPIVAKRADEVDRFTLNYWLLTSSKCCHTSHKLPTEIIGKNMENGSKIAAATGALLSDSIWKHRVPHAILNCVLTCRNWAENRNLFIHHSSHFIHI